MSDTAAPDAAVWVLEEAIDAKLVRVVGGELLGGAGKERNILLTASGWARRDSLLRDGARSQHAFMAMAFDEADVGTLFAEHLVAAAAAVGFELRTTEHAKERRPHFDTAHQTIVKWHADTMAEAALELKAMIRNTLAGEAVMDDKQQGAFSR